MKFYEYKTLWAESLHCKSSRPAAYAWLAGLTLGMIAVSTRAADVKPATPGKPAADAQIVLRLTSPLDYQVFQRRSRLRGSCGYEVLPRETAMRFSCG